MVTKRNLYEPMTRIDSAIKRLNEAAEVAPHHIGSHIREVIKRDLEEAYAKLEYAYDIA